MKLLCFMKSMKLQNSCVQKSNHHRLRQWPIAFHNYIQNMNLLALCSSVHHFRKSYLSVVWNIIINISRQFSKTKNRIRVFSLIFLCNGKSDLTDFMLLYEIRCAALSAHLIFKWFNTYFFVRDKIFTNVENVQETWLNTNDITVIW